MNSFKRPKRGQTEDDLIREQQEFLAKHKIQKVVKQSNDQNIDNKNKIADNHDLPQIVCNIIEKNVNTFNVNSMTETINDLSFNGFPKAMRRSDGLVPKRGKSLFAQQLAQNNDNNCNECLISDEEVVTKSVVIGKGLGVKEWKNEMQTIRTQNDDLIHNMDETEILEMREQLMSKLDKRTVDFLRNKRFINKDKDRTQSTINTNVVNKRSEENMETDFSVNENDLPIKPNEIKESKWLNMDVIEKDKLSWIGDIADVPQDLVCVTNSARFDFSGCLIDNNEEMDVRSGLHHHGLEQSSPGYTIQELYTFVESTFSSQKVIGLQVFTKIFAKAYQGLFDVCFNGNVIVQLLKNSALVLITRKCIDDNAETVWRVAINALHAILCNTIVDELFLDRGFLLFNEDINNDKTLDLKPSYDSTVNFDKLDELSDEQLAQMDVIVCLVQRTSLLERIRFLLDFNKCQLDLKSVNNLLDILIRISRHSSDSRQAIIKCPYLLDTIIKNFIPVSITFTTNDIFNKQNPKALKLMRILTVGNSETTLQIIDDFPELIQALKVYLTLNPENCDNMSEILQLSIESLRIWSNLVSQKVAIPHFLDMFPIIVKQLQFCQTLNPISDTNVFDFQYASTLISLVKNLIKENSEFSAFNDMVCVTLLKWLTIIKNEVIVPNFDSNIAILSAIQFILMAKIDSKALQDLVLGIISCNTLMNKLINSVIDNSNLVKLNAEYQGNRRDSPNLPSFGSVYYRNLDNIAILNNNSSICLLSAIIRILRYSSNQKMIIKLDYIKEYITKVANNLKFNVKLNLFDLYELNLLSEICLLYSKLSSVETEDIHCILNISILMISFVKNDRLKDNLIENVIFNKSMHTNKFVESIANINIRDGSNSHIITEPINDSFENIKIFYKKFSDFNCSHWLFDPIIKSLKANNSTKQIYDCLLFIDSIVTNHKNYLTQMISSTSAVFCLISSVFLISENMFFDNLVQNILQDLLLKLLRFDGLKCQKEHTVPYFETTGDFFAQFLSQFESVSYGNKLFINYLLVFCQRKCSSLFRTKLFYDNPAVLRVVNINFNEVLLPMDSLLFPIEDDLNVLETYLKSLLCEALDPKHSPVLYLIAIHHLNHALFRSTKVLSNDDKQGFNKLIRSVYNSSNNQLKFHLTKYSHFDQNLMYGISLQ